MNTDTTHKTRRLLIKTLLGSGFATLLGLPFLAFLRSTAPPNKNPEQMTISEIPELPTKPFDEHSLTQPHNLAG